MKRLITVLGIILLAGVIAIPVLAKGQGRGRGGDNAGYRGHGPGSCQQYANLTEEQGSQLGKLRQRFYDDTVKLRTGILSKSGELNILMNSSNPNAEKVRALQKEVSELKAKMAQERLNLQLEARKIAPDARFGRGYGPGSGCGYGKGSGPGMGNGRGKGGRGGYGPGACRN